MDKASVSFDDICLELPSGERILEGHCQTCQTCQTLNVSDPFVVLLSPVTRVLIAGVSGEFKAGRMCHLLAENEHVDVYIENEYQNLHNFLKISQGRVSSLNVCTEVPFLVLLELARLV